MSLGWPPYPLAPLLFVGFVPLLFGLDLIRAEEKVKGRGWRAWRFSFSALLIWNVGATWWVSLSTLGGGIFANIVNSMLMTLPLSAYLLTRRYLGKLPSYLCLISTWVTMEWFHLHWEFTWPWLNLGNGLASMHYLAQWYDVTGTFGGSVWILLLNILLYECLDQSNWLRHVFLGQGSPKAYRGSLRNFLLVLIIPIGISLYKYFSVNPDNGEKIQVALLQPNFDPHSEKFAVPSHQILASMLAQSKPGLSEDLDYLVWPETALTDLIRISQIQTHPSLNKIRALRAPYPKLKVITGINAREFWWETGQAPDDAKVYERSSGDSVWYKSYNSAIQIDSSSETQLYHKGVLVPGPENFPYDKQLSWLADVFPAAKPILNDLSVSKERSSLVHDEQLAVAPAICYESIFGFMVRDWVRDGSGIIFVITNDGWWANSKGRIQHMHYAKLRAIETRRYVGRSANTGVSCIINQRGDVIQSAGYAREDLVIGGMFVNDAETMYVRNGDLIARTSVWLFFAFLFVGLSRKWMRRLGA